MIPENQIHSQMESIKNFSIHLETIPVKEWKKLFDLLPEIERYKELDTAKDFESCEQIVDKTVEIIRELKLNFMFNHPKWGGMRKINKEKPNIIQLDMVTLCLILAFMIRSQRFGFLEFSFTDDQRMLKVIKGIKRNVEKGISGCYTVFESSPYAVWVF